MPDARLTALKVLLRVERGGGYSNLSLAAALRGGGLDARGAAFCTALVHGVLERKTSLDFLLAHHMTRPLGKLDAEVLSILRLGACQLLYMDAVPAAAAVDESVELCRKVGKTSAKGFVNGVLRAIVRGGCTLPPCEGDDLDKLALALSVPRGLLALLADTYGPDTARRFLEDALRPAPLFARVNTLRTSAPALIARLAGEGVQAREGALPGSLVLSGTGAVESLPAFREGLFHVQDISSQRCALLLSAGPGMRVLDACAAPGGKAFTIAEEMGGQGEVVACDLHPHKAELIRSGAQRLGLINIIPKVQDAREYNDKFKMFDRVLCDVPCSGLGVIRRRPEIRHKPLASLADLPRTQYNILENASHYLKDGGLLLYSTCTLHPAENGGVAERFLKAHPDFEGAPLAPLGGKWQRTFFPFEEGGGDGFFVAALRRRGRGAAG